MDTTLKPSHGDIHLKAIFDVTHERYALMQVGWNRGQRVRGNLFQQTEGTDRFYPNPQLITPTKLTH